MTVSMTVAPVRAQPVQVSIYDIETAFMFKLRQDSPTQVPIGTPPDLVFVAVGLLLLPSLVNIAGNTIGAPNSSSSTMSLALSCPVFTGTGTLLGEDGCA